MREEGKEKRERSERGCYKQKAQIKEKQRRREGDIQRGGGGGRDKEKEMKESKRNI